MSELMKEKKRQDRAGAFKRLVRQFGWAMQTAVEMDDFAAAMELQKELFAMHDELLAQVRKEKEDGD